ncbi:MAG: heat-inducible transcriptional repressor HrcA [Dehalococcoidia bacterium]
MTTLTNRKSQILSIIVNDYVNTAAPVASGTVVRSHGLTVSSATVRNEMGALEEEGYILRPHISAGGIPSDKGYRYHVQTLGPAQAIAGQDAWFLDTELGSTPEDVDGWADAASSALAALLNTLAFATPPRAESTTVKGIEVFRLQELVVMLVVILQEASIYKQLITLNEAVSESELEATRNRLSEALVGKSVNALEASGPTPAEPLEQQIIASTADILRKHEAQALRSRRMQGLARLFAQPELTSQPHQARNVVTAIEDGEAFAVLAGEASADGAPVVLIGRENRQESLHEFSVVVCRYGVPGQAQGVVGLIAPTRMPYGRAIPVVQYTASALSSLAGRVYGIG